jgi:transposase
MSALTTGHSARGTYGTIAIDLERRPIALLTDCSTESWATWLHRATE